MSEREKPQVTVVGLGRMGVPIATAFLDAGYATTVWNRSAEKADALVARGAARATTAAEAVRAAPLVIAPLLDHDAVRQALEPATEALRGRTLVNVANTSAGQARDLAAWAAGHGADYLDGAMMALPRTVATPDGFFLYSGSERAFTAYRSELEVMAPAHYFGTDPGAAEIHDLALLGTGYAALTGFLHAAALLDSVGTAPQVFAPLAARWLYGMADFLPQLAAEAGARTYTEGVSTIDLNRAGVDSLVGLSRAHGIATDVHEPLKALLDRRSADGHGHDSFSSVFELLRATGHPVT
ncbi:NAD(P)-dependent oxidoreductase [Actinopolymorpha pittospori]|uniref:3-hydroxyisobutyrate dehydrogenase-like beta-hydroxyacid dehydrogenase n=1 Tax=Actinopolymorpha pittospori TaxID=648752 RepID=A0A927N1Y8_9ACTN|nr:NAD(P)-binding domain-containing protein [Actinopolymorpha pittospori]MBE1610282.1 3-hydroxyisobutyrate dehydrogenase-like beta-hydroxyacid dehydrogenase [Actinopolymorpha pittospori]